MYSIVLYALIDLIQMTLTMDSREGQLSFENTYPLCPSPSV